MAKLVRVTDLRDHSAAPKGARSTPKASLLETVKKLWDKVQKKAHSMKVILEDRGILMESALSATIFRADGRVEDLGVICRKKVTQAFVKRLANQLANNFAGADSFKYHDSGTGTTAESNADTGLETPTGLARVAGTQADTSSGTTGNYRTVATITYNASYAITEHGVFNASTAGTLLDRSVFAAINVANGDSIQFTYDLTINPEA
jgi:hypothetical protein